MIAKDFQKLIGDALKAGDQVRLSTLRMLSSSFNYERINLQHELTDEEELNVIRKEAKKRRDSIEAYTKADRKDLADKEQKELEILQEYLPAELTDEQVSQAVEEAISETGATSMSVMGKVMGLAMKKLQGNADGNRVSALVKQKLAS